MKFEIVSADVQPYICIDGYLGGVFIKSQAYNYGGWQFKYSTRPWPKMTDVENFEIRTAIREKITVLNVTDRIQR